MARRSSWRRIAARASTGALRRAICCPSRARCASARERRHRVVARSGDPADQARPDTKYVRHIRIQSALLTKFWGRPMYLSAIVLVPEGFDSHPASALPADHFARSLRRPTSTTFAPRRPIPTSNPITPSASTWPATTASAAGGLQELSVLDCARHAALADREAAACQSFL